MSDHFDTDHPFDGTIKRINISPSFYLTDEKADRLHFVALSALTSGFLGEDVKVIAMLPVEGPFEGIACVVIAVDPIIVAITPGIARHLGMAAATGGAMAMSRALLGAADAADACARRMRS